MVKNKFFKKAISGITVLSLLLPNFANLAVSAEEPDKFQYTMFGRNGITISVSSNLCMNGNLHTNKDVAITAINKNINGKVTTSADIEKRIKHVYADQKIYDTYFTTNCEVYEEEYVYSDMNIHINNPLFCYNNITLDGNVSLNSSLGALMNINVTGEVKNANNSVVYSKFGNITIENDSTANVNGLIYAPLGTVTINSPNVTINGIIIADQVVINGSSVNINGNDNIARFIGETSENYDFSGLEYLPEEWLGDTDADGLFDIYEKVIDSDPFNPDTDGDGLPDGYEVLTLNTDPLEIDTDGNGVFDGNEDFDTDNLVNIDEYTNQTLPFTPDTDMDGFVDGDEVHIYGTTPTNPDTDTDKLLDGEESYDGTIYLEYGIYFDPLNPDTDGDGISDGDEVFGQTKTQEVQTQDEAITEVVVDMETNGNIDRTLTVESMQDIDAMTSNVYALIGEPFNFETESSFESATITFKIDQSKLGDTLFDNLMILWYNEEEQTFEEMPTAHDIVNSTVSTTTTHFSQYMVVDSEKWYENWNNSINELRKMWTGNTSYQRNLNTIILMDCSSSMASTDNYSRVLKEGYNGVTSENIEEIRNRLWGNDVDYYCVKWCDRFEICDGIINNKGGSDAAAIITFSNEVISSSGWLYSQSSLRNALDESIGNYGGTANWRSAVNYALSMVETDTTDLYRIIIISDNKANSGVISSDEFASNVILNVVNVGSSAFNNNIEAVAQATGGDVYNTITSDELTTQSGGIVSVPPQFIGEDSDGDTIPDIVEQYGLKPNGELIGTNLYEKDTDGDGIEDNIELNFTIDSIAYPLTKELIEIAVHPTSDPTEIDSDDDGLDDDIELVFGTTLMNADTDSDNLNDGYEVELWYDPINPNPDGDSYNDSDELKNNTSPYVYTLNAKESVDAFAKGMVLGEFDEAENFETLAGQITGSFIPFYADGRDYFANIIVHQSTGDAIVNLFFCLADLAPIGVAADVTKVSTKIGKFLIKFSDDAPKVIEAIIRATKLFPDDDLVPALAKAIPASSLDDVVDSIKSGDKITKAEYNKLYSFFEAYGRNLDEALENSGLILRGNYSEQYTKKLKDTYLLFREKGYKIGEHGLNRVLGRIMQGKIGTLDEVFDVLESGKKYADTVEGGTVIFKNGISVHFSDDGFIKSVVGNAHVKSTWEVIE